LGEGDSSFSNKGPGPLQRGDNHKNVKMGWSHLKIFYSRITGPILIDLAKIIRIGGKANKGDNPSPREDNSKRVKKYTEKFQKSSSPEPAGQNQSNLVQIILGCRDFKSFFQIICQVLFKGEIITKM
jgi:hypothetical protein